MTTTQLHAAIARELAANHPQENPVNQTDDTAPLADPTPPPMPPPPIGRKLLIDSVNLRELYAGLALQGVLAAHAGDEIALPEAKRAAKWCREFADALLIELAANPSA